MRFRVPEQADWRTNRKCLEIRPRPRGIKTTYRQPLSAVRVKPGAEENVYNEGLLPFVELRLKLCKGCTLQKYTKAAGEKRRGQVQDREEGEEEEDKEEEKQTCLLFYCKHWSKTMELVTIRSSRTKRRGEKKKTGHSGWTLKWNNYLYMENKIFKE